MSVAHLFHQSSSSCICQSTPPLVGWELSLPHFCKLCIFCTLNETAKATVAALCSRREDFYLLKQLDRTFHFLSTSSCHNITVLIVVVPNASRMADRHKRSFHAGILASSLAGSSALYMLNWMFSMFRRAFNLIEARQDRSGCWTHRWKRNIETSRFDAIPISFRLIVCQDSSDLFTSLSTQHIIEKSIPAEVDVT